MAWSSKKTAFLGAVTSSTPIAPVSGPAETLRWFGQLLGFTATDPRLIVTELIRIALQFMGVLMVVIILWAGFSLMLSGGDSEKVATAKKTLYNAIIGMAIILSAYSIVTFVVRTLTAATGQTPNI